MKCLLCSAVFDSEEDLTNHYISYHKIHPSNRFFQSSKNYSVFRKCLRCNDFLATSDYIKNNDLKHYHGGNIDLFEDKHVEKTANLLKFEITVNKSGKYYDFTNTDELLMISLKMYVHVLNRLV